MQYACYALHRIYKQGYQYKKAGVILAEIMPEHQVTAGLFDTVDRAKHKTLMGVMDKLNHRFGREKVKIGKQGFGRKWQLLQEKLSPCYTTQMDDIIQVM